MKFADPFAAPGKWYKGNLHTHTTESDGALDPAEVVRRYREAQYDFLALTDHGRVTVAVTAGDQSGVDRVALYVDGKPLGEKSRPPYEWTLWPGNGYHTFYAEATDASPNHNTRRSFARTVEVKVATPPF